MLRHTNSLALLLVRRLKMTVFKLFKISPELSGGELRFSPQQRNSERTTTYQLTTNSLLLTHREFQVVYNQMSHAPHAGLPAPAGNGQTHKHLFLYLPRLSLPPKYINSRQVVTQLQAILPPGSVYFAGHWARRKKSGTNSYANYERDLAASFHVLEKAVEMFPMLFL